MVLSKWHLQYSAFQVYRRLKAFYLSHSHTPMAMPSAAKTTVQGATCSPGAITVHKYTHTPMVTPSAAIWCSVSCPRTRTWATIQQQWRRQWGGWCVGVGPSPSDREEGQTEGLHWSTWFLASKTQDLRVHILFGLTGLGWVPLYWCSGLRSVYLISKRMRADLGSTLITWCSILRKMFLR